MNEEEKKAIELMEICMLGTEEAKIIKKLIQKQQQEIEKVDEIIDNLVERQIEREKYINVLEEENGKLEKIIDEMAEHLKFLSGGLEIVRDSLNIEDYSKEEIKQYFYRKVEEDV